MNWFWIDIEKRLPTRPKYKQCQWREIEIPAFRWELARRLFPLEQHPAFIELSRGEFDIVVKRMIHGHRPVYIRYNNEKFSPHEDYAVFHHFGWDLRASDTALTREFLNLIAAERKAHRIPQPKKNKGNYNSGVSWRYVQLLETRTGLNDTERSVLAQARKKAEELKPLFLDTWREILEHREFMKRFLVEHPDFPESLVKMDWSKWL